MKIFIPIKEKSQRVPNKNFRLFNGIPLYKHTLYKLKDFEVWVDTDSDIILKEIEKDEKLLLQIESVYETFKRHVVTGRKGKLTKPINEIVGGRVFTGKQALALGLIDEIGGLSAALNHAARAAGLGDVNVRVLPEPKDPLEQIFEALSGQFGDRPSDIAPSGRMIVNGLPGASSLFDTILPQLNKLDPKRMQLVKQCMTRIELLNQNRIMMMMPIDTIIHGL